VIGDSLAPLAGIWERVLDAPERLADGYEALWLDGDYTGVRAQFNAGADPVALLYLLARCVKNAPRFGRAGFNQSADRRRRGMRPDKMRAEILGAHALLRGGTRVFAGDAHACLAEATTDDLVYLDPPWQGTTEGADKRYHAGFARARLEALLTSLNERGIPWLLSYDGRLGSRRYGPPLPRALWREHFELPAGRSSQATLLGRSDRTVESLYAS
jgi:DNA adenine methylase